MLSFIFECSEKSASERNQWFAKNGILASLRNEADEQDSSGLFNRVLGPVNAMFNPSRDQARRFLIDTWAKYRAHQPLTPLESLAAGLVALHPEYHATFEHPEQHADRDYSPETGDINPFLHLSLHLAVAEQLAIDQPPGIRAEFERIRSARGDEHAALHEVLECLGEVIWQAQRQQSPPDAQLYLDCLQRK